MNIEKNSLIKFVELQDFRTQMYIVADDSRKAQFKKILDMTAFASIRKLVEFMGYENLSQKHTQTYVKNL